MQLASAPGHVAPWMVAMESQLSAYTLIKKLLQYDTSLKEQWACDEIMLKEASPFAWDKDPIQAVLSASRSIPSDTKMETWNLETDAVWWYFKDELPFQTITNADDKAAHGIGVRALCMAWVWMESESAKFPKGSSIRIVDEALENGPPPRKVLCGSLWMDDIMKEHPIVPSQTMMWEEGDSLSTMLERSAKSHRSLYGPGGKFEHEPQVGTAVFLAACEGMARFTLAGLAWLNQRVLVESEGHIERHRRKDFNRQTGQELSTVRVISLRRSEHTPSMVQGDGNVEWSCRWTVDGHWRNQPVGLGHAERRLTWINPYVKGPDDKELRVPKRKVYVVNR